MAIIYFKDEQGKKVSVEISNKIAKQYRESLREEWRSDAYESYYSTSLESIAEARPRLCRRELRHGRIVS